MNGNTVVYEHGLYLAFPRRQTWIYHCTRPGCPVSVEAETDGLAIRKLAHHLVHDHMTEQKGSAA